jgi:hypothetical protein
LEADLFEKLAYSSLAYPELIADLPLRLSTQICDVHIDDPRQAELLSAFTAKSAGLLAAFIPRPLALAATVRRG